VNRIGLYSLSAFVTPALAAVVLLSAPIVHAEAMSPAGTYVDAKTQADDHYSLHYATGKVVEAAKEVKVWAKEKYDTLASYWTGKPVPAAPAAGPGSSSSTASVPAPAGGHAPASAPMSLGVAPGSPAAQPVAAKIATPPAPMVEPPRSTNGVAVYDLSKASAIPRLNIGKEEVIKASHYYLEDKHRKVLETRVITAFNSPDAISEKDFKALVAGRSGKLTEAEKTHDVVFSPKGKVSRDQFDKFLKNTVPLLPEAQLNLKKVNPLSAQDIRFLSALLLYQAGDKCPVAVGLFHRLSKATEYQIEADYYLAMCSKELGLMTDFYERSRRVFESQDVYYSRKMISALGTEVPSEYIEPIGIALQKVSANSKITEKLDTKAMSDMAYNLTEYSVATEKYKAALDWSKKVPSTHAKYLNARFLQALAEYQVGSKDKAFKIQDEILSSPETEKSKQEFQALVALNAARMQFQEKNFKGARTNFLKVYKDHPLWLQSLTEMGWAQLQSGDYEGAIGNMYSIHSPFFSAVYKPESYVIRAIGYLNLCQYGDAYKTLSILEHDYRPVLDKIDKFTAAHPSYYQTVKHLLTAKDTKEVKEIDGLPLPVIREMARHREFTNLQKSLNRHVDERALYTKVDEEVDKSLSHSKWLATNSSKRVDDLNAKLAMISKKHELEQNRNQWLSDLEKEKVSLQDYLFEVDLYTEAKAALPEYHKDVRGAADTRIAAMHERMEKALETRLAHMKTDLARVLENNELLRYEVFAGSGENIRYQVAGGQTGNRVPASVMPKSKSLQWDFDGEYWEDEIGHYRSSLKNNCPEAKGHREQARLDGGAQ
jgi:hypothetical protein